MKEKRRIVNERRGEGEKRKSQLCVLGIKILY